MDHVATRLDRLAWQAMRRISDATKGRTQRRVEARLLAELLVATTGSLVAFQLWKGDSACARSFLL